MLDAILTAAGQAIGAIGSEMVGIRVRGRVLQESPYTTPDAMLREEGADRVAMEVTSHAIAQERVHGLRFGLGVFTNLAPLEHKEYHPTFEHYLETILRYFDHLRPGAPLVYFAEDPSLQRLAPDLPATAVSCGSGADASAWTKRCGRCSTVPMRATSCSFWGRLGCTAQHRSWTSGAPSAGLAIAECLSGKSPGA
jgi:UDP-N-acetylmuramoyl-L-alanyl-D-glutamate--2,6-diaminopimelate ligase